jgi:hypothetical protein
MKRVGKSDPVPDNAPNRLDALVKSVYPNGWQLNSLGTHIEASSQNQPVAATRAVNG